MEVLSEPVEVGAVICVASSNVPVMRSSKNGSLEIYGNDVAVVA